MTDQHVIAGLRGNLEQAKRQYNKHIERLQSQLADKEADNKQLRSLLGDFYESEMLLYRDSCCSDCDQEEFEIREKIRDKVKATLKGGE